MALIGIVLETLVSESDALTTQGFCLSTDVLPAAEVFEPVPYDSELNAIPTLRNFNLLWLMQGDFVIYLVKIKIYLWNVKSVSCK